MAVSDGNTSDYINIAISLTDANDPPVFQQGDNAARTLDENTAAGQHVGLPLTATDQDGDTLTYSLSGADAGAFDINAANGQLLTKSDVVYDFEGKRSYSVTAGVNDGNGGRDSIAVTITLTDVDEDTAPTLSGAPMDLHFTVGQNVRVLLPAAVNGSGNGAPYTYNLLKQGASTCCFADDGFSFNQNNRVLSGMPTIEGTYAVAYQVHDGDPNEQLDDSYIKEFLINVRAAPLGITATASPNPAISQQAVTLTAVVGGGAEPYTYTWTQRGGPTVTLTGVDTDTAMFTAPDVSSVTDLQFDIEVQDSTRSFFLSTGVTAKVSPPVTADAGPDQVAAYGDGIVILNASRSIIPYGTWEGLYYTWRQVSGPAVNLHRGNWSEAYFRLLDLPHGMELEFEVTVSSPKTELLPDTDIMVVTVGNPDFPGPLPQPTANAGSNLTAIPGELVRLDGKDSVNPRGEWWQLRYEWRQEQGQSVILRDGGKGQSIFVMPDVAAGVVLVFKLTVTTPEGESDSDTMNVTAAANTAYPRLKADAGPDLQFAPGETVTLGSPPRSINPHGHWSDLAYFWTQLSGPPVSLSNAAVAAPSFTAPEDDATLAFHLRVTDAGGRQDGDSVTVTVGSGTPSGQARAVAPCVVDLGELAEATELDAAWNAAECYAAECYAHHRLVSPAHYFQFTLSQETVVNISLQSEQPAVMFVSKGTPQNGWGSPPAWLEHRLEVRRNSGKLLHEEATQASLTLGAGEYTVEAVSDSGPEGGAFNLTIAAEVPNAPPVIAAAADLGSAFPGETVQLIGLADDDQDAPVDLTYLWEQVSGAAAATLENANTAAAAFTAPPVETDTNLTFRLTVTDSGGLTASAEVTVTVLRPLTACAGPDLTAAPGETVALQGTCSHNPYGDWWALAHSWSQLSGPTVTLSDSSRGDPSFTLPADASDGATLEFELTVTDKEGESDSDTMTVTVAGAEPANTPPTAAIDAAQVLRAVAGETVALQGGGDAETAAESLTFAWSQAGGTPTVSIASASASASASTATASFTAPEETGLTFRLTVTDEGGLSSDAEIAIAVSPPPEPENTPPTFDEGDSAIRSLAENSAAGPECGRALDRH